MKFMMMTAAALAFAGVAHAEDFKASSPEFADGTVHPAQFSSIFGCTGQDISPEIKWSGAPKGTKSFLVTMYDKDAPTGSGFWHWVVVDIPADATSLAAGAGGDGAKLPNGARNNTNDASMSSYLGACPPPGEIHEYKITVKALSVKKLDVPANATPALIGFVSNMNKLAEATVVAKGSR